MTTILLLSRRCLVHSRGLYTSVSRTNLSKTSSSTDPMTPRHVPISAHLTLRKVSPDWIGDERGKRKSLVVMFPWLGAKPKAIDKYCELYHEKGLDVLCVKCNLKHFLWPKTASKVAAELLEYLSKNETPLNTDAFIVHSFSVGSYVYTVTLMEIWKHRDRFGSIATKIKGQVFDSIVYGGLNKMLNGIATTRSDNRLVQTFIKGFAAAYMQLTRPFTVSFYDQSVAFIEDAPVRCPTLVYYCVNDPMCDSSAVDVMLQDWRDRHNVEVYVKCWERSVHACHLREHPEQYQKALQGYLGNLRRQHGVRVDV